MAKLRLVIVSANEWNLWATNHSYKIGTPVSSGPIARRVISGSRCCNDGQHADPLLCETAGELAVRLWVQPQEAVDFMQTQLFTIRQPIIYRDH